MAIVTSRITWLREKIAANQELASKIEDQLSRLEHNPPTLRPRMPRPQTVHLQAGARRSLLSNSFVLERNLLEVLSRQLDDPSLAHYPPLAMKIAARMRLKELKLSRPADEELRGKGSVLGLLRTHLGKSRKPGGTGIVQVVRAGQATLASIF